MTCPPFAWILRSPLPPRNANKVPVSQEFFFFSNFKAGMEDTLSSQGAPHCITLSDVSSTTGNEQLYLPNEHKANPSSSHSPAASPSDRICQ